jgi:hypothetical protein
MTVLSALDSAGRRHSPATMPGYHAGRARLATKGCATPPTRQPWTRSLPSCATPHPTATATGCARSSSCSGAPGCASRKRSRSPSTIWTRGADRCSSATARAAAGARSAWTNGAGNSCVPGSPLGRATCRAAVLHHRRPHSRATVVRRGRAVRVSANRRQGRRQASLRAAPAATRACARAGARRCAAEHHPAPARPRQPRHDVDLPTGDRPRGDHRHRPHAPSADDVRQRRAAALIERAAITSGSATALPLHPGEASAWAAQLRRSPLVYSTHAVGAAAGSCSRRRSRCRARGMRADEGRPRGVGTCSPPTRSLWRDSTSRLGAPVGVNSPTL